MQKGPPPYRCKFHGGLAGAPLGNQNARKKLGLYADGLNERELDLVDKIHDDNLQSEINLLRLKIQGCIEAHAEQQELLNADDPEAIESAYFASEKHVRMTRPEGKVWVRKKNSKRRGAGRVKPTRTLDPLVVTEVHTTRRVRDYMHEAREYARILAKMLQIQRAVSGEEGAVSDSDRAVMAAQLLREAKQASGITKPKGK